MGAMIGLAAIGLATCRSTPPAWQQPGAALDLDFANERYWWNGQHFATRDLFLAAIGGAVTDGVTTFPWTDASIQIVVDALVPEEPTGNEVLYSLDDGSETNCLRARRDSASQVLRIFAIAGGTTLSDIGTQTLGRGMVLRSSQSTRSQNFAAAANGTGSGATTAATAMPAVTTMRIGRGASANLPWSGQIRRLTIYPDPATDVAANTAASLPPHDLWLEGDSYAGGSAGIGLGSSLARQHGRYPLNDAIGGSTLDQAVSRILARTGPARNLPLIYWDGDNNGFASLADDLARYDQIAAAADNGRYLLLPPTLRAGQQTSQRELAHQLTMALRDRHGDRCLDPMPTLLTMAGPGDADNVANGTVPASLLQDGTHLTRLGMDAMAQLVMTRLRDLGWA